MKEMKADLTTLKECLTSLNETVTQLSGDVEQHKNWTKSELADLQSSINNPPTEMISRAVLLKILPYMNDIEQNLFTDLSSLIDHRATSINESVGSLSGDLEMYKNWTMSELATIRSSLPRTILLTLLPYMNNIEENLMTDLSSLMSDRATSIDESLSSLRRDLEMHTNWTILELADLQTSLQFVIDNPPTGPISRAVLLTLLPYLNNIEENIVTDLSSLISDRATSIDASVSSLSGDFEEHKNETTSELADLQSSLQSSINSTLCQKVEEIRDTIIPLPVHTCGGTGGWRQAVYRDMTDPNTTCPSGWRETGYSKRTCGRASTTVPSCDSVTFSVSGGEYSQVCGRIKAYQWGLTWGFWGYNNGYTTIDDAYFSGVAVMHGSSRQHIWTFAAGVVENYTLEASTLCPCDTTFNISVPPFVGEDYFCESGYIYPGYLDTESLYTFHSNDTLWDGRDCHSSSTCCSHHNPPYFTKTFSMPTTDDIELRMCINTRIQFNQYVDIAVELIELYVKN